MDQFIIRTKLKSTQSNILRGNDNAVDIISIKQLDVSAKAAVDNEWKKWHQENGTVSLTQTICNERHKTMNTSVSGWRVVDGKKTYYTFRDHQLVHASGHEGFKLFHSDHHNGKLKENNKRKPVNDSVVSDVINTANKENTSHSAINNRIIQYANKKQRP